MTKISDMAIVVTGASSGIGRAVALRVAAAGGTVGLIARSKRALKDVAEECRARGGTALELPADVSHPEQLRDAARQMVESCGRIDVWVNNAGVFIMGRLEELPAKAVRRVVETDLLGYLHGAQAVIPYFREQKHGILINVGSVAGLTGQPFAIPYAASKAGVEGISKSLRMELRDLPHVRVCTMRFPSIDTPLFGHAANYTGLSVQPVTPILTAEAAARAIARLISHPRNSAYLGGATPLLTRLAMLPGLGERLMAAKVDREQLGPHAARVSDGNLFAPSDTHAVSGGWIQGRSRAKRLLVASAAVAVGFLALRSARRAW